MPDLSIIISVFNRLDLTQRCLQTLERSLSSFNHEVIIVDDGSTDGTRDFLRALRQPYRVILNEEKQSFAFNNNRGAALARADTLCLLNNDTELPLGWHAPMLNALARFPGAGCIGNVHRLPTTNRYDHFGVCFPPWLTPIHYGQQLKQFPRFDGDYSRWGAVSAACIMIRRDLFASVGGFNHTYINGCEDIDLCLRLHALGHWHYVAHKSVILHHKCSSPGRKIHNNANLIRLKAAWKDYLERNLVPRDTRLAAQSYLLSSLFAPRRTNLGKLWGSVVALTRSTPAGSLRKPECFS